MMFLYTMFTCDVHIWCHGIWCSHMKFTYEVWHMMVMVLHIFGKYHIWCSHMKFGIWFHMWTLLMFTYDVFVYDVHMWFHIWCHDIWCSHMMFTYEVWHMISHVNFLEDHIPFPLEMHQFTTNWDVWVTLRILFWCTGSPRIPSEFTSCHHHVIFSFNNRPWSRQRSGCPHHYHWRPLVLCLCIRGVDSSGIVTTLVVVCLFTCCRWFSCYCCCDTICYCWV